MAFDFWDIANKASSIATLISFPLAIIAGIGIFIAWGNKVARAFIGLAIIAFIAIFCLDVAVRAGAIKPTIEDVHDCFRRNERIVVDGHSYSHCRFANITLVFNGSSAGSIINDEFVGSLTIGSDNPAVRNAFAVLAKFGLLRVPAIDEHGKIIPLGITPH